MEMQAKYLQSSMMKEKASMKQYRITSLIQKINQVNKKQIQLDNEKARENGEGDNNKSGQNHLSTIYNLR